jgi:lipoyl(octanoyl) transferase
MSARSLDGFWLGRRPYDLVHDLQRRWQVANQQARVNDAVFLLEHENVITLGRGAHEENILFPIPELKRRGFDVAETGRGGDVTLHAPGQLVAYPIVNLSPERRDIRRYVKDLTEVMRRLVLDHGIQSGPVPDLIGLWVDRANPEQWNDAESAGRIAKIGAIGVRVSRWVTMHGFALNSTTDLSLYDAIVPCGIADHGVTSIETLTGRGPAVADMAPRAYDLICKQLGAQPRELHDASHVSDSDLELWAQAESNENEAKASSPSPT